MNTVLFSQQFSQLRTQRNFLAALSALLSIAVATLSVALMSRSERIIVTPPTVEKEFWVEGERVSPSYLEMFGTFIGQLILSKSPGSSPWQRSSLLRHAAPEFSEKLKVRLLKEEEMLKCEGASYVYFPSRVQVDPVSLQVLLKGNREFQVAGKLISREECSYLLSFKSSGGRILLSGVQEISND